MAHQVGGGLQGLEGEKQGKVSARQPPLLGDLTSDVLPPGGLLARPVPPGKNPPRWLAALLFPPSHPNQTGPAGAGLACLGQPRSSPGPRFPCWQGPRTAYSRAFTRASLASMRIWISALEASSAAPDSSACAFSKFILAACRKWVAGESQARALPGAQAQLWPPEPLLPLEHSPPRPACPRSRPLRPTTALKNQCSP